MVGASGPARIRIRVRIQIRTLHDGRQTALVEELPLLDGPV